MSKPRKTTATRPRGRPEVEIDLKELRKLAQLHCTEDEIAAFFECSKRTVIRKLQEPLYREAYDLGKAMGKLNLRRRQVQIANGNRQGAVNMAIHLGRHWLGQTDRALLELSGPKGGPIEMIDGKMTAKQAAEAYARTIDRP